MSIKSLETEAALTAGKMEWGKFFAENRVKTQQSSYKPGQT